MKATEIRVGNWVKEESLGYKQWGLKDFDNYHGEHYPENWISDKIEPIPLTPEILEKAGFASDIVEVEYQLRGFNKERDLHKYYKRDLIGIQYVHELQNLIFALTGRELEISL